MTDRDDTTAPPAAGDSDAARAPGDEPPTGLLLVISGPSGAGKTTIARRIEQARGGLFSVSVTTRDPTPADTPGVDYDFVELDEFHRMIDQGELLEYAGVYQGDYYGTPRLPVEAALRQGRLVITEVDIEGAAQIRQSAPHCLAVFIKPPSEEELLERLRRRAREDESAIQRRFAKARAEIQRAEAGGIYDRIIVNDDLEQSIEEVLGLIDTARTDGSRSFPSP